MNRLMPCTFPLSFCLAVVAVALALVACGGSMGRESVTSAPVVESAPSALDDGIVSESGVDKVPACHKGENKMVPKGAVEDHLGHGDTLGSCSLSATCPCFSEMTISAAVGTCTNVLSLCSIGASASLFLTCSAPNATVVGVYEVSSAGTCSRSLDLVNGPLALSELPDVEYQACVNVIVTSEYCLF